MTIILQCPVCRNPLLNSADGYQCSNNHTFDAAREGYVNLLLAHKKNSKEPGDSKEMTRSRRRFLDLGRYDRISDGINEAVAGNLPGPVSERTFNILDAGCGEGFYLKRLKEFLAQKPGTPVPVEFWSEHIPRGLPAGNVSEYDKISSLKNRRSPKACSWELQYYGVDISKFAVRQATQRDRTMDWFVAGIKDLPFAQSSLDMVLNVFSPADFPEFSRVLRETGGLLIVSPGPRHLNGLREIIYPNAREHAPSTITEEAKQLFSLSTETRINYQIELQGREAIMDLLAMTPYFWNIDLKTKAKVETLDRLALDVDVEIRVFKKRRPGVNL